MALSESVVKSVDTLQTSIGGLPTYDSGTYNINITNNVNLSYISNLPGYYQREGNILRIWKHCQLSVTSTGANAQTDVALPPGYGHAGQWNRIVGGVNGYAMEHGRAIPVGTDTLRFLWRCGQSGTYGTWFTARIWIP